VSQDSTQRHRQGRGDQEHGGQQVDEAHHGRRVDDEHQWGERDTSRDLECVPSRDPVPGVRIADRDDERERRQQRASDRPPTRVGDQLEQEEVRQQQDEEAGVAVDETNEVSSDPHARH